MSDPVAAKSSFLCMYMSNHPDTLVSYVRYWGKVKEKVASAQMLAIDSKGMTLKYTTKAAGGGETSKEARVLFDPPLSGYDEVKSRLLQMKAEAEESLGMMKVPQITTFELDASVLQTAVLIVLLTYVTFSPPPSSPAYGPVYSAAAYIRAQLPTSALKWIWIGMFSIHGLESIYMLSLCRKHGTPFVTTILYLLANFSFGYPVFLYFRRRVQAARIDSILKGQ